MNFLIPNIRNQWFSDVDRFFEPVERERFLSLDSDIEDSKEHIIMSFDVPGMKESDFSVKVEGKHLLISGERKREETKSENSHLVYSRRSYGKFEKAFALPETVESEKIEADYRDGVLRVYLPKTAVEKEKAIDVKVKGKDTFFDRFS